MAINSTWEDIDRGLFGPSPNAQYSGGLSDDDGSPSMMPSGEYFSDELEFQSPRRAAIGAALMMIGSRSKDPSAVVRAVQGARAHNTRLRRLSEPRYRVVDGRLLRFDGRGNFLGEEQLPPEQLAAHANDQMSQGNVIRPNQAGTYDTVYTAPDAAGSTRKVKERFTAADGGEVILYDDGTTERLGMSLGRSEEDMRGLFADANTLRDDLTRQTAPFDTQLQQYERALGLANVYANPNATPEDKTQADRGLTNMILKTWDPTSAVMGGEFDSAAAAQSAYDKALKSMDLTTGEIYGDETRKAIVKMIRAVQEGNIKRLRGAYDEYLPRAQKLDPDNLNLVLPGNVLTPEGGIKDQLFDYSPYSAGLDWALDRLPMDEAEDERLGNELGKFLGGGQ